MEEVSLSAYWDLLNQHDWYYSMSDDARVYNKGEQNFEKLATIAIRYIAKKDNRYQMMFEQFSQHMWSGKPWNTQQAAKPIRPEEK